MTGTAQRPPVLALGSGITLLGVLRILSGQKENVIALPDADRVTRRSRWYRSAPLSFLGLRADSLPAALESLPAGTVLMPCSDFWARTVAALPSTVLVRYPASIAPLEALDILVDKGRFGATLDRLQLPHPGTRSLSSVAGLDEVPDAALESSFLKPVHSQQFFARFGVKAFRISGRADARKKLSECESAGFEMMLQVYIPGPPTNHYFIDGFVDRDGVIRALFARQRLRMSPPDFGNTTLMVSVPPEETGNAVETLRTLFADIRYRGIFSAEFKRDARDGTFNLIEVNARPWWYVEFAARCGVDVCRLALQDARQQRVDTISTYEVGRRCVFPYYDLHALRAERLAGRIGVLHLARSWLGAYQPVFRWSDPIPALGEVASLLRARIGRHKKPLK